MCACVGDGGAATVADAAGATPGVAAAVGGGGGPWGCAQADAVTAATGEGGPARTANLCLVVTDATSAKTGAHDLLRPLGCTPSGHVPYYLHRWLQCR